MTTSFGRVQNCPSKSVHERFTGLFNVLLILAESQCILEFWGLTTRHRERELQQSKLRIKELPYLCMRAVSWLKQKHDTVVVARGNN